MLHVVCMMKTFLKKLSRSSRQPSGPCLQILSDLHLEVGRQYSTFTFPASAPFLVLAGDIGRLVDYDEYLGFLKAQASRYKKIFLVLGNHEFYELDYERGIAEARRLTTEPSITDKVVLLHRTRWDDAESDLTIIGCTLWSAIPAESREIVEYKISDFKKISQWTVQKHNDAHAKEVEWLCEQAWLNSNETGSKRRTLIVTHHAPCMRGSSRPEHTENAWSCAFATELLGRKIWNGVSTWAFGHTHYSTDFAREGVRVVANQRGYVFSASDVPAEERKKSRWSGIRPYNGNSFVARPNWFTFGIERAISYRVAVRIRSIFKWPNR